MKVKTTKIAIVDNNDNVIAYEDLEILQQIYRNEDKIAVASCFLNSYKLFFKTYKSLYYTFINKIVKEGDQDENNF